MKNNLSPYARTPVRKGGYLDILTPRPVPINNEDILFEITTEYTYRPDLLRTLLTAEKTCGGYLHNVIWILLKILYLTLLPELKFIYLILQHYETH